MPAIPASLPPGHFFNFLKKNILFSILSSFFVINHREEKDIGHF